jgi:hypothetical protein
VKIGRWKADEYGYATVPVTVTNHSSKRSEYFFTISLESPNGATQYDTATLLIDTLESGPIKADTGYFIQDGHPGERRHPRQGGAAHSLAVTTDVKGRNQASASLASRAARLAQLPVLAARGYDVLPVSASAGAGRADQPTAEPANCGH